jgi:hypothetical protein
MTKKISCRVISSVLLSSSADTLRRAGHSNNKRDERDDVVAVNARVGHADSSVIYTRWLDTARVSVDDCPAGQVFDCYV